MKMNWFKKKVKKLALPPSRPPEFKIKFHSMARNNEDIDNMIRVFKEIGKEVPYFNVGDTTTISFSFFDNLTDEQLVKSEVLVEKAGKLQDITQRIEVENLDRFVRLKAIITQLERFLMLTNLEGKR